MRTEDRNLFKVLKTELDEFNNEMILNTTLLNYKSETEKIKCP